MKVRIGIQLGQWPSRDIQPEAVFDLIDFFEALDVDSIWVSDRLVSTGADPRTLWHSFPTLPEDCAR
jgi:hypothetical protein